MKRLIILTLFLYCCEMQLKQPPKAVLPIVFPPQKAQWFADTYWTALAWWLAGKRPPWHSALDSLTQTPEWQQHQWFWYQVWQKRSHSFFKPLWQWSKMALQQEHKDTHWVLYPFSGPDYLTIAYIFPKAKRYLFFGLEPEGHLQRLYNIPKWDRNTLKRNLTRLQQAMDDILLLSFFKTKDMAWQLRNSDLDGTLPLLLTFLGFHQKEIIRVRRILIHPNLQLKTIDDSLPYSARDTLLTGVEILFRNFKSATTIPPASLIYLSHDVSNYNLIYQDSLILSVIRSYAPANTFLKAASYLLHYEHFSLVRQAILQSSKCIVQDDSGFPIRFFPDSLWEITLYGNYVRPIRLFASKFQPQLYWAYRKDTTIVPLSFRIGYGRLEQANLQVIRNRRYYGVKRSP